MFESNLINSIVVWDRILEIEETRRRDPFGDFPEGNQPIDLDQYPFLSIFKLPENNAEPECAQCPQNSKTQPA
jgi:hypothetical protein